MEICFSRGLVFLVFFFWFFKLLRFWWREEKRFLVQLSSPRKLHLYKALAERGLQAFYVHENLMQSFLAVKEHL